MPPAAGAGRRPDSRGSPEGGTNRAVVHNNPINHIDPLGLGEPSIWQRVKTGVSLAWGVAKVYAPSLESVGNFVEGALVAYANDNTANVVPAAIDAFSSSKWQGPEGMDEAHRRGAMFGHVVAFVQGAWEVEIGGTLAVGGTAGGILTSPTGVGAVAGGSVAVGGVAVTAHGVATSGTALNSLITMMKAKERRAAQRVESTKAKHGDEQFEEPASEEYAKWKAQELEKAKGKGGRREAHDLKQDGMDRSKRQLDEDYE